MVRSSVVVKALASAEVVENVTSLEVIVHVACTALEG